MTMSCSITTRSAAIAVAALLFLSAGWAQATIGFSRPDDLAVTITAGTREATAAFRSEISLGEMSFYSAHATHARNSSLKSQLSVRTIGLHVARRDGASGHAILRAYLLRECDRCNIRLDGVALTTSPTVIPRSVPFNVITNHLIEVEVPITAPAGALDAEIGWQIEEL